MCGSTLDALERENQHKPELPQQDKVSTTDPDAAYFSKGDSASKLGYAERVSPSKDAKPRPERKLLPQHLKRASRALCRRTQIQAFIICTATIYRSQPAGPMPGASFTKSMWCMLRRPQPKRWPGSALFMRSRLRFAASPPILG